MNSGNGTKVLARSQKGRMMAGVCAGVAGYFGIDVTLVRVIAAVVSVITGGAGVPACIELRGRTPQRRAPFRSGMSATSLTRYSVSRLSVPSRRFCPE